MFGYALPERRKIRHCRSGADIAVGKAAGALEHRLCATAHPNRNRPPAVRFRPQRHVLRPKKFSPKAHRVFLPEPAHELHTFQPTRAAPLEWHFHCIVIGLSITDAHSEREPTLRNEVNRRQSLCQKHRPPVGQEQHRGAQLNFSVAPAAAANAASGSKLSKTRRSLIHNEWSPSCSQCLANWRKKSGATWGAGVINDRPRFTTNSIRP